MLGTSIDPIESASDKNNRESNQTQTNDIEWVESVAPDAHKIDNKRDCVDDDTGGE